MIEHEMVFALGFFTAGLLALACLPAVWRRALRLTNHRLRQLVPLSPDEIAAERAGLRAQLAVEQRRLEQRIEQGEAQRSTLLAELGRRETEVARLSEAAARDAASIAGLGAERDAARREAFDVAGQMGAATIALHELDGLADRYRQETEDLCETVQDLHGRIDQDRASIAAFETRVLGLDTRVGDLIQALDKVTADLVRTSAAERSAVAERDAALKTVEALTTKRDLLASTVDRLNAQLAQETARASASDHRAIERTQAAAAQAETIEDLRAQVAMHGEAARARAGQAEPRAASPASDADLDALREAIRRVADDVLKMASDAAERRRDAAYAAPEQ